MKRHLLAAVEAGGTKFRGAVASADMTIVDSVWVPTTLQPTLWHLLRPERLPAAS